MTACPSAVTEKALTGTFAAPASNISSNKIDMVRPGIATVELTTSGGVVSAATVAVAALVSVSALPLSSVKLTLTLMVLPRSAASRA